MLSVFAKGRERSLVLIQTHGDSHTRNKLERLSGTDGLAVLKADGCGDEAYIHSFPKGLSAERLSRKVC